MVFLNKSKIEQKKNTLCRNVSVISGFYDWPNIVKRLFRGVSKHLSKLQRYVESFFPPNILKSKNIFPRSDNF